MLTVISDPVVAGLPVVDNGEPLVSVDAAVQGPAAGVARLVRVGVATRLTVAAGLLPAGVRLHLVEGYRRPAAQQAVVDAYAAEVRRTRPGLDEAEMVALTSRYVAPLALAPHVAGAAVDITLADEAGAELWMGSALDATPEESGGTCYTDAPGLDAEAQANRRLLVRALAGAGLVNYPTEWWHWSYGDRYWAHVTGASAGCCNPADPPAVALGG